MNLNEQIDALSTGVDHLIDNARAAVRKARDEASATVAAAAASASSSTGPGGHAQASASAGVPDAEPAQASASTEPQTADAAPEAAATAAQPTLQVARPAQNEITMTINGQTVTLHPQQVSQLIEELAHARASMTLEQPQALPQGWRFVATKNPMMAVQKQASGDRLLVARHTGYGWVPFTFSPEQAIQLYMLLTQQ